MLRAFTDSIAWPRHLPHFLARSLVEGDDPMAAGMKDREVKAVLEKKWSVMNAMLDAELAILLLHIALPDLFPFEIETSDVAGADVGVDMLAIGARRGGGVIALVSANGSSTSRAEHSFPEDLALGADAEQHEVVAVAARQEDAVSPDCRSRSAASGQRQLPGEGPSFHSRRWGVRSPCRSRYYQDPATPASCRHKPSPSG